ncbi:MAG TPA: hypothetical protein VF135_15075 [Terriglobales bacterium]
MEEEGNSTAKLIFWAYLFVTSYPAYVFIKNRIEQRGGDQYSFAVGILLLGIDLAVLWWLYLMAYSGKKKRQQPKRR